MPSTRQRGVRDLLRPAAAPLRRLGYLRSRFAPPLGSRPPHTLAISAIFRNEARYLPEWVTFHRLQGVERFYLYDNLSTDNWRLALGPELAEGLVEVTPWPAEPGQPSAYRDCLCRHRDDARWIAFLDVDEFLFSPTERPLPKLLRHFDTSPAVAVNWRCFGSNGWATAPDGLLIENFVARAADNDPANRFVKSIVYPRKTRGPRSPHYFEYLGGPPVGEDGRPAGWSTREPATVDLLRVNHYFARSEQELRDKLGRPSAWGGTVGRSGVGSWTEIPPDEVQDDTILRFAPALRHALSARATPADPVEPDSSQVPSV